MIELTTDFKVIREMIKMEAQGLKVYLTPEGAERINYIMENLWNVNGDESEVV